MQEDRRRAPWHHLYFQQQRRHRGNTDVAPTPVKGAAMKGRILLVEDDATFRSFLQTILEDEGHEVLTATDGLAGLRLLRQEQVDLVVSDLKMPGKSGLELFR